MKKLYKVKLGKPTGGSTSFVMYGGERVKTEYFVVAKSFNEAGKMVMDYVNNIPDSEKIQINYSFGVETSLADLSVSTIELISDDLIHETPNQ